MFTKKDILDSHHRRYATKKFDASKRISEEAWATILEVGRLSPSSFGLEPWKILLIQNPAMKETLKPMAWGAVSSLEGASHFVVILAKKQVTYDSRYLQHIFREIKDYDYEPTSDFGRRFKSYQEEEADLTDDRRLFDWSSKQTYILLANMMTAAAMLDIDSCPIEGFHHEQVEAYLAEQGLLDPAEYGVSLMAGFGYRDQEITPKTRQPLEAIYQVVE